jgi:spermidine/putrescine ABC transporter ATP-binding subunit
MSAVSIKGARKVYGQAAALDGVSIDFLDGEFFGLLGPSGSGKTTLLRAIAGFVDLDEGEISIAGERVEHVPVHRRKIGMVFQNYALFPHLTVAENVGFGLSVRGAGSADIRKRVGEMLELVRLPGFEARRPRQLSGGQQQRVALARALITRPSVLLLDEPLGALDRRLRQEMQVELKQIQREIGITAVFVTHDQEEALTLSDRIAIINQGRLAQIGQPQQVYERPLDVFTARFLGDANVFRGASDGKAIALASGQKLIVGAGLPAAGNAAVVVRPEKLAIAGEGGAIASDLVNRLAGTVVQSIYSGNAVTYRIEIDATGAEPVLAFAQNRDAALLSPGTRVTLAFSPEHTIAVGG